MTQRHYKDATRLKIDFSLISRTSSRFATEQRYIFFFILLLHILFLFSTLSIAKENSHIFTTNRLESYLVKNAVEHAKHQYDIDILVKDELLDKQVAPWDKETLPAEKWISQVFKYYDKIAVFNNEGRVKIIKIVGQKNDQGTILQVRLNNSEAKPLHQNLVQAEHPLAADMIVFFDPPEYSPQEIEELITNHQDGEQSSPEGVTIHQSNESADSVPPTGVILANSPLENASTAEDIFTQ